MVSKPHSRIRLSREERYEQLVETAWKIIHEEGTEALTLGHLAERSGVTKPVVYDHFTNRSGLFAALYQEFDQRQNALMDEAIQKSKPELEALANVIATSYIECVLLQGREMPSVIAALAGTPELEKIRNDCAIVFAEKCRRIFTPFRHDKSLHDAALWAMIGAAEGLSYATTCHVITASQAKDELFRVIVSMVQRHDDPS
jgi:AcrR family transcriptional regulator